MNGLPNNLYTEGAVVFNSQPATNFYLQSMAKKRAKDEALDNWFKQLNQSVNPAGMRTADVEGLMSLHNDDLDFYRRNRDKIKNPRLDNGRAYTEYMSRHQNKLNYIAESKNEADFQFKQLAPIFGDPNKRSRLSHDVIPELENWELPIRSEGRRPFDITTLDYSDEPFDIAAQKKLDDLAMKDVNMSNMVQRIQVDPHKKTRTVTYEASYSPQDLQTIGTRYSDAYSNSDRKFRNAINKIAEDQDAVDEYDKIFESVTGRKMESNEDLAAAYGLARVQKQMSKQEVGSHNPYSPEDYQQARDASWFNKQGMMDDSIDEMVDRQIAQASKAFTSRNMFDAPMLPVDPATLKALNIEKARLDPDGRITPLWHRTVKDSKTGKEHRELVAGTPMTVDDWKAALGKRNIGKQYFQKVTKPSESGGSSKSGKKKIGGAYDAQ